MFEVPLAKDNILKVLIHCNSQATLARPYNKLYNEKSKHIGLRHSFARKLINDEIISVTYICSSYNLADPFIKDYLNRHKIGTPIVRILTTETTQSNVKKTLTSRLCG